MLRRVGSSPTIGIILVSRGAVMGNHGYCCWVWYFGDFFYTTSCGLRQDLDTEPEQNKCRCGRRIKRYIQTKDGGLREYN